ncbi:hypothetical protein [Micromonospora sp. HM5-17]|jgi:hypothetical protein|uniref:hypothetical protein n=1 Tax=Micromonospora sp. HM5-17 TaxID=2487710 RepID=UPI000F470713|nr:hypothetical protein [Micromonospora sp. HM5-17]ROT32507.1 hypothetical protein EF879_13415 [Micromonospora sp. HM5-17]
MAARDDWREVFRTEARRRGLPRWEVREALAEVEAYCAGSDADPVEAFGEPARYAAELAAGRRSDGDVGRRRRLLPATLVASGSLAGVMSLLAGVDALARGGPGEVTLGQLVSVVAGIAGIVLVAAVLHHTGRTARVGWRFGLAGAAGIAVTTAPQLLWTHPVWRASGWLLVGVGLLLVAAAWWPLVSGRLLGPARGADPGTGAGPAGASARLLGVVRWGLPAALICAVLLAILVGGTGLAVACPPPGCPS